MKPLLSICIPTYNRDWCIKEQINTFSGFPQYIWNKIEIIISDNCSTDRTRHVVENAISNGFPCTYVRNNENLGMDRNFTQCYNMAQGNFVWLLGDDDFVTQDGIVKILNLLNNSNHNLGVVHFIPNSDMPATLYDNSEKFLTAISYNMTFISGSIINTSYVHKIDLSTYHGTLISHVPLILNAILESKINVLCGGSSILCIAKDAVNNGGYNFFQVFVINLLSIWHIYLEENKISKKTFRRLKRELFTFVYTFYVNFFIKHNVGNFKIENAWRILIKYYGNEWYFWYKWLKLLFHKLFDRKCV